jgi:polynucleotide 5'-kinase involved in rRNA processing
MQKEIDLNLGYGSKGENPLKCLRDRSGVTLLFGAMVNPYSWHVDQDSLHHSIAGLLDRQGGTLALGVIHEAYLEKETLVVETPLAPIRDVAYVRLGKIRRV